MGIGLAVDPAQESKAPLSCWSLPKTYHWEQTCAVELDIGNVASETTTGARSGPSDPVRTYRVRTQPSGNRRQILVQRWTRIMSSNLYAIHLLHSHERPGCDLLVGRPVVNGFLSVEKHCE